MIALLFVSTGLAYFLSLPFASVLQGGGYRLSAMLRAKKALLSTALYLIVGSVAEVCLALFARAWIASLITLLLYCTTATFVFIIHRLMRMPMRFTRRLIRLLIGYLICYFAVFFGLYFTSFRGLWSVAPAVSPFLLAGVAVILSPFESINNRRYVRKASSRLAELSAVKIGITGSYGKTSVKHYLEIVLSSKYDTLVTPENYNTPLGVAKTVGLASGNEEFIVIEMGARRRGDIEKLTEMVKPDLGVITGIAPQHLETFHSVEEILAEKNRLSESIMPENTVFYNLADPLVRKMYDARKGAKIGVGYTDSEYLISEERFDAEGSTFTLSKGEEKVRIRLPCVGKACVINFSLAAAVAHEKGVSWDDVVKAGKIASAPVHRFEVVRKGSITVIDDGYNINPIGASVALSSLDNFEGKRKVVYTSGIVELGKEEEKYNRELGENIARVASLAFVAEGRYGDQVVKGIGKGKTEVIRVKDTIEASGLFGEKLREGDVLLIMSDLPRDYLL